MKKLLCERPRRGSSNPSAKTGKRLDPTLDYESGDFDWGPSWISSARHRQHGWKSKELNENLNPLENFLYSAVGRPWDDVYSEIRENIAPKKAVDFHILFHLNHMVTTEVYMEDGKPQHNRYSRWGRWSVDRLYVNPDTGLLCQITKPKEELKFRPKDSFHWHDNLWFKKEIDHGSAKCGCVHFFDPILKSYSNKPALAYTLSNKTLCRHGNPPISRELWYVIEYGYHGPDEVYKVYTMSDYGAAMRYHLTLENPVHKIYYRDVPKKMEEPFVIHKKSVNKKEMKHIRRLLENDDMIDERS